MLHLLKGLDYRPDTMRTDFLDYCLTKINAECEPYAVRSYSIHCAFKMSRHYPELAGELEAHLELLALQPLSPGLLSALRTTRHRLQNLKKEHKQ